MINFMSINNLIRHLEEAEQFIARFEPGQEEPAKVQQGQQAEATTA